MHIAIDCRFVRHSGIGRYITELVPRLVPHDEHRFTLIVSKKEWDQGFVETCTRPNVQMTICNASMYSIREQVEMPMRIPACDIFWSPHYNVPLLPIRAKKKLVTIHDVLHLAMRKEFFLPKRLYAKLFLYAATHFFDKVLTVSEFSKQEILRFEDIDPKKITVIYPAAGSDFIKKHPTDEEVRSVCEKYRLTRPYFLYVGNIKPHKNLSRLLEAYQLFLQTACPGILPSLVLVGRKDTYSPVVASLSEETRSHIRFTGYVEDADLPAVYRGASLFLFPSLYEGFGIPPLEAMAQGVPVLASNAASIPEICGDVADYFDPTDVEGMAEKIATLWRDNSSQDRLRKKGLKVLEKYGWERSVLKIMQKIKTVSKHEN